MRTPVITIAIKVGTAIALEVIMQLKKRSNPSARWDSSKNSWWIGEYTEYQWTDERTKEYSPWMTLEDALVWIQKRDQEKNPGNSNSSGKLPRKKVTKTTV